ncbi:MAG: hypothetical protein ACLVG5_04910 [Clostridium sp.]
MTQNRDPSVRMTPMEKAALLRQANDQHKTMSEYIRSIEMSAGGDKGMSLTVRFCR